MRTPHCSELLVAIGLVRACHHFIAAIILSNESLDVRPVLHLCRSSHRFAHRSRNVCAAISSNKWTRAAFSLTRDYTWMNLRADAQVWARPL
jgi:hypothetical protein